MSLSTPEPILSANNQVIARSFVANSIKSINVSMNRMLVLTALLVSDLAALRVGVTRPLSGR